LSLGVLDADLDRLLDFFEADLLLDLFETDRLRLLDLDAAFAGDREIDFFAIFFESRPAGDLERFDSTDEDLESRERFDLTESFGDCFDLGDTEESRFDGDTDFFFGDRDRDFLDPREANGEDSLILSRLGDGEIGRFSTETDRL